MLVGFRAELVESPGGGLQAVAEPKAWSPSWERLSHSPPSQAWGLRHRNKGPIQRLPSSGAEGPPSSGPLKSPGSAPRSLVWQGHREPDLKTFPQIPEKAKAWLRRSFYSHIWPPQPHLKLPQTAWAFPSLCLRKSLRLPPRIAAAEGEGVVRKWFAKKGLFYCNYLESVS